MNPVWFSQALVWIGVAQGVISQIQDACGSNSKAGLIAGSILVVIGKIGHLTAVAQKIDADNSKPKD